MRQFIQIFNFKYIHVVINEPVSIKGPITQKGTFKFTLIWKSESCVNMDLWFLFESLVSTFTKQMVQLAITQLRPEFERMAGRAAEKAIDSKMGKVGVFGMKKEEHTITQNRLQTLK